MERSLSGKEKIAMFCLRCISIETIYLLNKYFFVYKTLRIIDF